MSVSEPLWMFVYAHDELKVLRFDVVLWRPAPPPFWWYVLHTVFRCAL